jgi:hypothetical protein
MPAEAVLVSAAVHDSSWPSSRVRVHRDPRPLFITLSIATASRSTTRRPHDFRRRK